MNRTLNLRLLLALALITLPALGLASARQEKFRLKETAAVGDQVDIDGRMSMALNLKVILGGKAMEFPVSAQESEKYRDEVLAVDAAGTPTGLRRTYEMKRETMKEPGEKEKRTVSGLEGKTVEIRRDGEKVTVTVQKGKITDEERQELIEEFQGKADSFYPDRELSPGEEWTVAPEVAARIFSEFDKATVKCRFQDIAEYGGRRCARIHLMIDAAGKFGDDAPPADIRMTGDLYQALDLQRPLAVTLTGTITMKSPDGAGEGAISGTGTMQARETYRWLKVAGKAPAKP